MEYPPMKLTDEFRFSKHKGLTVETVILESITWMRWAIDGAVIRLDNEAFKLYETALEEWKLENPDKD